MCSLTAIDENSFSVPFEPSIESGFSLYVPDCDLEKEEFLDSPFFLPLRATIAPYPLPFSEREGKDGYEFSDPTALVQNNGVEGLPFPSEVGNTLSQNREITQQSEKIVSKTPLQLHKSYIKKRISKASSKSVSTRRLFKEITDKGYRGTFNTVQKFIAAIREKKNGPSKSSISIIQNEKNRPPEALFQFYKKYISEKLEGAEYVPTKQLFEEMKANGYLGGYNTVRAYVSMMRKKQNKRAETLLDFHKEYIRKRLEEAVSTKELFEEIKAKGYQGTLRKIQMFVSTIRTSRSPKASFHFHKEYIKKRVHKAVSASESVSTKELFEEIKANGYLGGYNTAAAFISMICTIRPPEASLAFHKEYITKRLTEAISESVSTMQLFQEIHASGYLGSYDTLRTFVSTIREKKNKKAESSFHFHKEYITKRLEETASESVSIKQLFQEIRANGYLGGYNTVRAFVSTIREQKNKRPETSLEFHRGYIRKRLEEALPKYVSAKQLFEEIKAKGYQGTLKKAQMFVSTIRTSRPPEASLEFHKGYIRKRMEAQLECASTKELFEEIKANGYLGAYNTAAAFISMIRKCKSSEASLQFHKDFLSERIEEEDVNEASKVVA